MANSLLTSQMVAKEVLRWLDPPKYIKAQTRQLLCIGGSNDGQYWPVDSQFNRAGDLIAVEKALKSEPRFDPEPYYEPNMIIDLRETYVLCSWRTPQLTMEFLVHSAWSVEQAIEHLFTTYADVMSR